MFTQFIKQQTMDLVLFIEVEKRKIDFNYKIEDGVGGDKCW